MVWFRFPIRVRTHFWFFWKVTRGRPRFGIRVTGERLLVDLLYENPIRVLGFMGGVQVGLLLMADAEDIGGG